MIHNRSQSLVADPLAVHCRHRLISVTHDAAERHLILRFASDGGKRVAQIVERAIHACIRRQLLKLLAQAVIARHSLALLLLSVRRWRRIVERVASELGPTVAILRDED